MTINFEIAFTEVAETGGDAFAGDVTSGVLKVSLGATVVWDFEWSLIDVLEHLAANWKYLQWEEQCPLPVDPHDVQRFDSRVETALAEVRQPLDTLFYDFRQAHDLSQGLKGIWVAPLWILRRGRRFHVWSENVESWLTEDEFVETFESLANTILDRVSTCLDGRAELVREAWAQRKSVGQKDLVAISTGFSASAIESIVGEQSDFSRFWDIDAVPNELLAAARMMGQGIDPSEIRRVLEQVRTCRHRETPELDELSAEISGILDPRLRGHDQGYEAARWLRDKLGNHHSPIESIRAHLKSFHVALETMKLSKFIDAVCCWGPRHGPLVILNTLGRHNKSGAGRRATIAHELGHLLMDRNDALPLAEVLGGRVSMDIEERARAFAAELLIPQRVIEERVAARVPIREMVELLRDEYRVSSEIIAWQARNSKADLNDSDYWYLRSKVLSHPERF